MKKTILLSLLSCFFMLTLSGEEVKPAGITDWIFEGRSLRYSDGIGVFTGYALYSRGFIPVDPAKKYVVFTAKEVTTLLALMIACWVMR